MVIFLEVQKVSPSRKIYELIAGQAELDPNYDPEYNPDLFEGDILLVDPSEADLPNGVFNFKRPSYIIIHSFKFSNLQINLKA